MTAPLPRPLGRADHAALGASRTVTLLNLMPFAVLGLSWALVGETIHAYHVAGAALVVTGVYRATRPT